MYQTGIRCLADQGATNELTTFPPPHNGNLVQKHNITEPDHLLLMYLLICHHHKLTHFLPKGFAQEVTYINGYNGAVGAGQ